MHINYFGTGPKDFRPGNLDRKRTQILLAQIPAHRYTQSHTIQHFVDLSI